MTVSSTSARNVQYTANGSQTTFTVPFVFINPTDLEVYLTDTNGDPAVLQTITTDYTVSGGGSPAASGSITFLTAPTDDYLVTIQSSTTETQEVSFIQNAKFPSSVIEGALDQLTLEIQDLNSQLSRTIQSTVDSETTNIQIAKPNNGYYLVWDTENGNLISNVSPTAAAISAIVAPQNGLLVQTTNTIDAVTIDAGTGITITNGSGYSGEDGVNPSIAISSSYVGQTSLTTLGTISTGTWEATLLSPTYGGTGVNNGSSTITLGGNLTTSGAYTTELTVTGNTNVTLPTSGTLATLSSTMTGIWEGTVVSPTYGGTGIDNGSNTITLGGDLTTSGSYTTELVATGNTNVTLPTSGTLATTSSTMVGSFEGNVISPTYGGTGVDNGSYTLSLAGDLSTSGAYSVEFIATGSTSLTLPTSGTLATTADIGDDSGTNCTIEITIDGHGLSVGDIFYFSGSNAVTVSDCSSVSSAEVSGIVTDVEDSDHFTYGTAGIFTSLLSGLTGGDVYFLSTSGSYSSTPPSSAGYVIKPLFTAINSTDIIWQPMIGSVVGSSIGLATDSEVETASSTTLVVPAAYTHYNHGVSKAGVNWVSGGTTINEAWNVSSITRVAAGEYTVNFANNFANTNYRVYIGFVSSSTVLVTSVLTQAEGYVTVEIKTTGGTLTDPSGNIWVDCFGTW